MVVPISTTFHPDARLLPVSSDLILVSSDGVFFYTHSTNVLRASSNSFNDLLSPTRFKSGPDSEDGFGSVVPVPERAAVFNILLHAIYNLSCACYCPTLDTLVRAIDAMPTYGISPKANVAPSRPLYALLLAQAPIQPIAVYALAARHDIHELAVPVSSHLLSHPLKTVTLEQAAAIGPMYMKKLIFMHLGRLDALKRLLVQPPPIHPATPDCGFAEQKRVTRAWMLASAYLAWDGRPDMSASAIESALRPLATYLSCGACKKILEERVKQVVSRWAMVKRTI